MTDASSRGAAPPSTQPAPSKAHEALGADQASTGGAAAPTPPAAASQKPVDDGRNPPAGDLPNAAVDLTTGDASSAPGMPHERDETVGMVSDVPDERVKQAHADVERGLEDTSRGTEADSTYQKQTRGPNAAPRT